MLNRLWLGFFLLAFAGGLYQWLVAGDLLIFQKMVNSVFDMSKTTVNIAIGLVGALSFWLGIFKIAEGAGLIEKMARGLGPLFGRLMPGRACRSPGHRQHDHEFVGQYVRPRQCRHTNGHSCHA